MGGVVVMATETVVIRPMVADDLEAVVALEAATYREPWSAAVWEDELRQPNRVYLSADLDGNVVGYGGMMIIGDDAHVTTVVSDPDHAVPKLGTRLMLELVERAIAGGAGHLTLEVRTSNTRAQALYRKFGMAPVGVRKNYYRGEDALIMWVHDIDGDDYRERLGRIREEVA